MVSTKLILKASVATALFGASHGFRPLANSPVATRSTSQLNVVDPSHISDIAHHIHNSAMLLSYEDERMVVDPALLGTVGLSTIGLTAVGAGLIAGLSKQTGVETLSEEELVTLTAVDSLYDTNEADRQPTESGTIGFLKRDGLAQKAKASYQRGKNTREMRDKTLWYDEIEFTYLAPLLRIAKPQPGETFVDLGSGMGRAVLGAASLYDWSKCVGIELLADLHKRAGSYSSKAKALTGGTSVEFKNADFITDDVTDVSEADVIFAYATKYASRGIELTELAEKLAATAKKGARIITIDRTLPEGGTFRLIKQVDDRQADLQRITGYVYQKVK